MSKYTFVWQSEYSESSGDGLVAVKECDNSIVLVVERVEEDMD